VGELFGLGRQAIEKNAKNMDENIFSICQQFYQKKKSVDEICSFNDMDKTPPNILLASLTYGFW